MHYKLRKHNFSNRIVAIWNSLPNTVVSAESTDTFINNLDKFWANQDFKIDWNADITGIGGKCLIVFRYKHKSLGPGSINSH